ncbi:MAG: sensor histidine kinase [Leifsonia sp.]|nr:sensor histidine kinase [Leifsonia sp.]
MRTRILASILIVTALGLAASGIVSYLVQRERVLAAVDQNLLRAVPELRVIAARGSAGTPPATVDALLRAAMQQMIPDSQESVLGIINGKAALVPAASLPFRIDSDAALVRRLVAEASPTNVVMGTAVRPLGAIRYIIVPVAVNGDTSKGLYVAAYNLDSELGAVVDSFQSYIAVALAALVVVGLVGWFVAGRLLRPIRLLREAASRNSIADLSERIPVVGRDDISDLTSTINQMFDRLEESSTSQRRLLDDVGHELKTPITIVRGHLELLDAGRPDDVEGTRALAIDELDRMSDLVSEISLLAESRAPDFVTMNEVDLGLLTESVRVKASALAPEREWMIDRAAVGTVRIDARRITQAWLQLAENAVKYSAAGLPIAIGSDLSPARTGDMLQIWVQDGGPGIPLEDQARIFERFGRLESSRRADGSGLGLSIVTAIAQAHGGDVDLVSTPETGSTFTIRIPIGRLESQAAEAAEREEESA